MAFTRNTPRTPPGGARTPEQHPSRGKPPPGPHNPPQPQKRKATQMTDWLNEIEEAVRDKEPPYGWWPNDEQARRWLLNALDPYGIRLEEAEQDVKLITHAPAHIRRLIAKVRKLEQALAHERELNADLNNQIDVEAQHATGDCDVCTHLAHVDVYEENERLRLQLEDMSECAEVAEQAATRAEAKLARVEELHTPQVGQGTKYCQECEGRWPCPTTTALKGNNQ